MKHYLRYALAGLAMFVVALLAAFISMRLAIHGREVVVPNLAGKADPDAATAARKLGLNLSVENRFYSGAVAPNRVLSQSPAAGSVVRRGWQVRVTESLGGQNAIVPDVTGQTERPASLVLRRLQLDLGASAHLPAPGAPGFVLAQSPPPNSSGLLGPKVSILVSDPQTEAPAPAFLMPSINGLTIAAASVKLAAAGLRIASARDPSYSPPPTATDPTADPAIPPTVVPPPPVSSSAIIATQSPAPGHRVTRADSIRVSVVHTPTPEELFLQQQTPAQPTGQPGAPTNPPSN